MPGTASGMAGGMKGSAFSLRGRQFDETPTESLLMCRSRRDYYLKYDFVNLHK
jgi:hypothetical protein